MLFLLPALARACARVLKPTPMIGERHQLARRRLLRARRSLVDFLVDQHLHKQCAVSLGARPAARLR